LRNGNLTRLNPRELLVGDVVNCEIGLVVPCDGLFIEARSVEIDESALTGEPIHVKKSTYQDCLNQKNNLSEEELENANTHTIMSPVVLSGTKFIAGSAKFVVIVSGKYSCQGKIKDALA